MELGGALELALWGLGLWALLYIIRFFLVIQVALKVELRRATVSPTLLSELPETLLATLGAGGRNLEALGFRFLGPVMAERTQIGDERESPSHGLVYGHEATGTIAVLGLAEELEPADPFSVQFSSRATDGRALLTGNANAHLVISRHPTALFEDPLALDLASQFAAHRKKAEALGLGVVPLPTVEEFASFTTRHLSEALEYGVTRGDLREEGGRFVLPWPSVLRFTVRILRSGRSVAKYKEARHRHASEHHTLIDLPLPLLADAYRRQKRILTRQTPRSFFGWLFLGTGILFIASFVSLTGGWIGASILLVVVLFHELGHYLAMRLCGFADTTIFFLPFLGAATTGRKDDTSASEEMIVLLAGPLPGLLLGLLGSALPGPHSPDLDLLIGTAIVLNALNLLPIYPFDGGRIVHLLLFGRSVISDVVFQLLGAGLLLLAAWGAGTGLMLIPAALIVLALPTVVRTARIAQRVDRSAPREEAVLHAIHQLLGKDLAFGQQVNLARSVEKRLGGRPAGLLGTLAWGTIYGAAVSLGLYAAAAHFFQRAVPTTPVPMPDELDHPLEALDCEGPLPDLLPGGEEVGLLRLRCEAEPAVRAELDAAFDSLLEAPRSLWIPPPWAPELKRSEEVERAQHTLRVVLRHRQALRDEELSTGAFFRTRIELWLYGPEGLEARMLERSRERLAELSQLPQHQAGLDPQVVQVLIRHFEASGSGELQGAEAELWERLGGPPLGVDTSTHSPPALLQAQGLRFGFSAEQGSSLDLLIAPERPEVSLEPIRRYLCHSGCTRLWWGAR